MQQGSIKFYNDAKGFGFIMPANGDEDMFFHVTQCEEGFEPQDGDEVTYEVSSGRDGRPAATNVSPAMGGGSTTGDDDDDQEEMEEETQE